MPHKTGKIEILGIIDDEIYFKYHRAKNRKNLGKIFKHKVDEKAGWLDDFKSTHDAQVEGQKVKMFTSMDLIILQEELRSKCVIK